MLNTITNSQSKINDFFICQSPIKVKKTGDEQAPDQPGKTPQTRSEK